MAPSAEVSIQPKPKNGLEVTKWKQISLLSTCFNPAEAEEWFRSGCAGGATGCELGFNPAEAEEGFRKINGLKNSVNAAKFQSSRSRRMV